MINARAPLRISFVGGGTDMPAFFNRYPGRVISTTIDKYVYLVINSAYLLNEFIIKYQTTEIVKHPREFTHNRFRAALLDYGLTERGVEIGSFADLPAKTGLGSSSSFSVALIKALNAYLGKTISKVEAAEAACRLEIELCNEPIGKQDQYAAAFGGFNLFQFNSDGTTEIEPLLVSYQTRSKLADHLLLFFTGITRSASTILANQQTKIEENFTTYQAMSDSVFSFREKLLAGDIKGVAEMLHQGWLRKKSLSKEISNNFIENLYETGITNGSWGGKILGAGGGGCLLFLAPPEKHDVIRQAIFKIAGANGLADFREIPINFTQSGADIIFNENRYFNI